MSQSQSCLQYLKCSLERAPDEQLAQYFVAVQWTLTLIRKISVTFKIKC